MQVSGVLVSLAAVLSASSTEARALTRGERRLQQDASPPMPAGEHAFQPPLVEWPTVIRKRLTCCAGPPVTAAATSAAAPYVIDPWTVGMTYPDVNVKAGQSVEFKWPGEQMMASPQGMNFDS